jgi:phage terminase large subunit GpA-like protein
VYVCPECGEAWDDYRRQENIRQTVLSAGESGDPMWGWVPTAPFHGIAGFKELNELYSCLPGAGLAEMVKDYLAAEYEAARGDESERIVFVNSKLARTYAYKGDHATEQELRERADAEGFTEGSCPAGGLLLTVGIDVQRNPARVAVGMRAWGRGEESWLISWTELYASGAISDKSDPVWGDLEKHVFGPIPHARGNSIYASAVSIDSGDGETNDAVYDWARRMSRKYPHVHVMPIKGSNSQQDPEIFSTPRVKGVDHVNAKKPSKADKYGLKVYMVGTNKAKDLIASRLKLGGNGPGRMHLCADVRSDYFEQMTGEVKAPHRTLKGRKVWQPRAGRAVEAWDCEVYALHAARAKRVHLLTPADWDRLEQKLLQADMFKESTMPVPATEKPESNTINAAPVSSPAARNSMADLARRLSGQG